MDWLTSWRTEWGLTTVDCIKQVVIWSSLSLMPSTCCSSSKRSWIPLAACSNSSFTTIHKDRINHQCIAPEHIPPSNWSTKCTQSTLHSHNGHTPHTYLMHKFHFGTYALIQNLFLSLHNTIWVLLLLNLVWQIQPPLCIFVRPICSQSSGEYQSVVVKYLPVWWCWI